MFRITWPDGHTRDITDTEDLITELPDMDFQFDELTPGESITITKVS